MILEEFFENHELYGVFSEYSYLWKTQFRPFGSRLNSAWVIASCIDVICLNLAV